MMEPMDGWQTLRAIRSCPVSADTPVIIITGKQPVPEEILQYGGLIEDFVVKPVEFHKILSSLPGIIGESRYLSSLIAQKREEGQDPGFIDEYPRVLRLVRITHHLIKRFRDIPWADRISLKKQEERLFLLHARLGFPDRLLEGNMQNEDSGHDDAAGVPEQLSG
jgi:DNA-binding response OmpR family regulator